MERSPGALSGRRKLKAPGHRQDEKKNEREQRQKMTREQIERDAEQRLSSYNGGESSYEGGNESSYEGGNNEVGYLGVGDDQVSFNGDPRKSFLTEQHSSVKFGYKITNATSGTVVLALTPAFFESASAITAATGETCDGIITDGTIITNVTATALDSKHKIAPFLSFIKRNPTRAIEMIIQSNTDASYEETIIIKPVSPFRMLGNAYLPLTNYLSPDQFNSKKVIVPLHRDFPDFQFDDQNLVLLPIGGTNVVATTGVTLNITFKIGGVLNNAETLARKAGKAQNTMNKMRMRGVLAH
jgi:hypothetical protein